MQDPFREDLLGAGDGLPQQARQCAEPVRGEPAFDPERIDRLAGAVPLRPDIRFPHPMLERAVRVGLAHIDATFEGDHPKYGVGTYRDPMHDGFPPVIIAAVDALTRWQVLPRAEALLGYWLAHFVRPDGTIDYYGPSLSEYGMLLTTARRLMDRGGSEAWLAGSFDALDRLAGRVLAVVTDAGPGGLASGVPEADEKDRPGVYFHNNAWLVRGLVDWATVLEHRLALRGPAAGARKAAAGLEEAMLDAAEDVWPRNPDDWWLRPTVETDEAGRPGRPERVTATRLGSYTNYRYWPEMLSSRAMGRKWMRRIVSARLNSGGQFCGTSRFCTDQRGERLDDWPLAEWLDGLWYLGCVDDYRLCLWGHIFHHQAEGHLTAYEQVTFPPGRKVADYCLPCQLVAARGAHRLASIRGAPSNSPGQSV